MGMMGGNMTPLRQGYAGQVSMMGGGMAGMMGGFGRDVTNLNNVGNKWSGFGSSLWSVWGWWHVVLGSLTWVLFIALLVAAIRYLWKKGD